MRKNAHVWQNSPPPLRSHSVGELRLPSPAFPLCELQWILISSRNISRSKRNKTYCRNFVIPETLEHIYNDIQGDIFNVQGTSDQGIECFCLNSCNKLWISWLQAVTKHFQFVPSNGIHVIWQCYFQGLVRLSAVPRLSQSFHNTNQISATARGLYFPQKSFLFSKTQCSGLEFFIGMQMYFLLKRVIFF